MSNAFAIASVTQVLLGMLESIPTTYELSSALGGDIRFSASGPNRIASNESEMPGVNLFLYRLIPNTGWCNREFPSHDSDGRRTANPPLALDLFYLVSAYGKKDLDADILLGCAAQVFHENPVLARATIPDYLHAYQEKNHLDTNILDKSQLADQIEQIKITPVPLTTEEISKLWTACNAPSRSCIAYQVSVVLIESWKPVRSNLPVLTRGKYDAAARRDEGVMVYPSLRYPTLTALRPPDNQISAKTGDSVDLSGFDLAGNPITVECRHRRQDAVVIPVLIGTPTDTAISFRIPDEWPAGSYSVQVRAVQQDRTRLTNTLPMVLAPAAKNVPGNPSASRNGDTLTISLACTPAVLPSQEASIVIGDRELISDHRKITTDSLTFSAKIPVQDLPSGSYYYRIRVDGIESQLIDRTTNPPQFMHSQKVEIP
jgi:hypothetical protein